MYDESHPDELLSVREVGERYGISRSSLYRYIRLGSVHAYHRGIGRETYVPRSELDALQAAHQRDVPPPTDPRRRAAIQGALAVFGAWSDLDPIEVFDALDRIRHESRPTPPIDEASLFGQS